MSIRDYPNVRTDTRAIINELDVELTPEQKEDPLFVRFALLAKCKGFTAVKTSTRPEEKPVPVEFAADFVEACFGVPQ